MRSLFAIDVHGCLLKSDPGLELIAAVRAVMRGEQALSAEISAQLETADAPSGVAAIRTLSEREREVLTLVGHGKRNKEIAQLLRIKTSTVETYISNVMAKLGVHSRARALRVALQRGIIEVEDERLA